MRERFDRKLLVEGKNDIHVVLALCNYYQVPENFDVINCGSKEGVLAQLKIRLKDPLKNKAIGVLLDADTDLDKTWAAVETILKKTQNYDDQSINFEEGGSVIPSSVAGESSVGIWLMPDNKATGMLEDFVESLASDDDVLMKRADEVITALEREKIHRYKDVHRSKAKIHTFLAWHDEPGMPMGLAITARILDPSRESAKQFSEWLKACFR